MVKAIFFDRDGVLNDLVQRSSSSFTAPWRIEEFNIIESSIQAVKNASAMGFATLLSPPDVYSQLLILVILTFIFEIIIFCYTLYFKSLKYFKIINMEAY